MENPLRAFAKRSDHRFIDKWDPYFDIYHRHFQHLRGQKVNILEIGVYKGGSIEMWLEYFGKDNCNVFAIDIEPACKVMEKSYENVKVFIGDQSNREFLKSVREQLPPLDILIDDGGHTMNQQIVSFEELYRCVKMGGVYLCEDLHTSYWPMYGGSYNNPTSFIEYIKDHIDHLNGFYIQDAKYQKNDNTYITNSLHFYESVVVLEKHPSKLSGPPTRIMNGNIKLDGSST